MPRLPLPLPLRGGFADVAVSFVPHSRFGSNYPHLWCCGLCLQLCQLCVGNPACPAASPLPLPLPAPLVSPLSTVLCCQRQQPQFSFCSLSLSLFRFLRVFRGRALNFFRLLIACTIPHSSLASPASPPPLSFTLTDFATVAIAKVVAIFVSSCLPLLLQLRLCLGFWSWFVVYSSTSFPAPVPCPYPSLPGSTPSASSSRCVWSALFRTT